MHTPVLLQEIITGLHVKKDGLYIDATVGEGGHTKAILDLGGIVLGIDRDNNQIKKLKETLVSPHLILEHGNYSEIEKIAKAHHFYPVDGVIFDLGLSWAQLSEKRRGFSYRNADELLDMRLDDDSGTITAYQILNTYSKEKLYQMIALNSEEIKAADLAEAVVLQRKSRKYKTVGDLNKTIEKVMGKNAGKTYARMYQALRIEVNDEFNHLINGLEGSLNILNKKGMILVISFHSLEDRIVKQFIQKNNLIQKTKHVVKGDRKLSFERSAKLRICYCS